MENNFSFGMDGPIMSGTWINPSNGHKFTVRDCFFQDGQFIVQTTDGKMLDYNTIKSYVQCSDKDGKETPIPSGMITSDSSNLPPEILDMIEPGSTPVVNATPSMEDLILPEDRGMGLGNINRRDPTPPTNDHLMVSDPEQLMVEKVLANHPRPSIEATIQWETPVEQIKTLVSVLDVNPTAIADYYMHFLDKDAILFFVADRLREFISSLINEPSTTKKVDNPQETVSDDHKPANSGKPKAPRGTSGSKKTTNK